MYEYQNQKCHPDYVNFSDISWYSYKPSLNGITLDKLKELELWKFGSMGYSPIESHQFWDKDTNYFPFNFEIKPLTRYNLVGHNEYLKDRISLSLTFADIDYWTDEMKEL